MTATSQRLPGHDLAQEVCVNGRHVIATDEPVSLGGEDLGPAPHELLPAALASCIATMLSLYARERDWDLGDLEVRVTYETDLDPKRVMVTIMLPDDLTAGQLRRLARVAQSCPVRRALEGSFEFEETLVEAPRAQALPA